MTTATPSSPDSRAAILIGRLRAGAGDAGVVSVTVALIGLALALRGMQAHSRELLATAVGVGLLARGLGRGRSVQLRNVALAIVALAAARISYDSDHLHMMWAFTAIAGAALVLPATPPPAGDAPTRRRIWALIDHTPADTMAPFAMRSDKSYLFSPDGRAALAYRVKFGTAVASGDPVGDPASAGDAIDAFFAHARAHGWRTTVLMSSEDKLDGWRAHGLRAVPIGRDVLVDVEDFSLDGRRFRNLRQAVQRTHNSGVTTEIMSERDLDPALREELLAIAGRSRTGTQPRGFALILDHLLDGTHPGIIVAVARDGQGRAVAFQRFATANGGREISLDLPWRSPDAPNGVDERLAVDVIGWARERNADRVSLAFAAFPELFEAETRSLPQRLTYWTVHRLDRFIKLESLYRYLRKFHALEHRRFVALRPWDVLPVLVTLLTLEFSRPAKARRRRAPWRRST